jgi:hypothetical protein
MHSKLEGGDVPFAVDFRSHYASVIRDWLLVNPEKILGPGFFNLHPSGSRQDPGVERPTRPGPG